MRFPGLSDQDIKKELDKRTGIARPGPKEFLMDALSFAPALLGMPMGMGDLIKFPKKFAKPLKRGRTPKAPFNEAKQTYKIRENIRKMEEYYNPALKNPKVTEHPNAGTPRDRALENFSKRFHSDISSRVKDKLDKVNNYKEWKFSPGNIVTSKQTNKAYKITGKNFSNNKPVYNYTSIDGTESGQFIADRAHKHLNLFEGLKK